MQFRLVDLLAILVIVSVLCVFAVRIANSG